jgi:hypothetical protein
MKPLIVWEKWVDPFGADMDEAKWTDYENDIDNLLEDADDDIEDESHSNHIIKNTRPIKVIASPMGLIPYNEHTASSKIFNFWLGHTNFNISARVQKMIEECDGVEILDIFTRYRFRIAIGKCFNDSDVMKSINDEIHILLD